MAAVTAAAKAAKTKAAKTTVVTAAAKAARTKAAKVAKIEVDAAETVGINGNYHLIVSR